MPKILQIHYSKPPIFVDKMVKQLCNTQKVRHTELYYRHTRISNIKPYAVHVYIREQAKKNENIGDFNQKDSENIGNFSQKDFEVILFLCIFAPKLRH